MKPTVRSVWENAPEGQAFITRWRGDEDFVDPDGIVWIKGGVSDLDWDDLIWLAPIEIGEGTYND